MLVSEHKESLRHHLIAFHNIREYRLKEKPDTPIGALADDYIKDQLDMEEGMRQYFEACDKITKYNQRILSAIKTVKGKTFHNHLVALIKDSEGGIDYCKWQIASTPVGTCRDVTDYGRGIKKEWVKQQAVGDSGDSWEGTICVQLKPNKYLKFNFSM